MMRHRVPLTLELSPSLPMVLADRVQLQQVIINLVMNGIEAMQLVAARPRDLVVNCGRRAMPAPGRPSGSPVAAPGIQVAAISANQRQLRQFGQSRFSGRPHLGDKAPVRRSEHPDPTGHCTGVVS